MKSVDIRLIFGAWVSRIVFPIAILIVFKILQKEYKKRKNECNNIENDKYQKWLNLWSLLTIIMSMLTLMSFLVHKIPIICQYNYGLFTALWGCCQCNLTFYQIARLQFCFSTKRIHYVKYGYSNKIFIILFINGFICMLCILIFPWFSYNVEVLGTYGCEVTQTSMYYILIPIASLWFYIWDSIVLSMYIYKVYQIKKHKIFKNEDILKRVKFIMHKIVLLTIVYEVKVVLIVTLNTLFVSYTISSIWIPICIAIDIISTVFIIYLMIEHNNDEFINIIKKFYCCQSYIGIMEKENDALHNKTNNNIHIINNNNDESIFETQGISQTIRPTAFSMKSEMTKTVETRVSVSK